MKARAGRLFGNIGKRRWIWPDICRRALYSEGAGCITDLTVRETGPELSFLGQGTLIALIVVVRCAEKEFGNMPYSKRNSPRKIVGSNN